MTIEQEWANQNQKMRNEILGRIIPQVTDLWSRKNADYSGQQMFLGLKAQFCDINRKFWKLKAFLWDDKTAEFEDPIEVCKDMIGHLLMTIYFLELEQGKKTVMDIMTSKSEPGFGGILTGTPVVETNPRCEHRFVRRQLGGPYLCIRCGGTATSTQVLEICRAIASMDGTAAYHEWDQVASDLKKCRHCGTARSLR